MTRIMTPVNDNKKRAEVSTIYINVDHLEKGQYRLNILKDDKVIKSIEFEK